MADKFGKSEVKHCPRTSCWASLVWRHCTPALLCPLLSDQPCDLWTSCTAPSIHREFLLPHSSDISLHSQCWKTNLNTSLFCMIWEQTTLPREATKYSLKAMPFRVLAAWRQGWASFAVCLTESPFAFSMQLVVGMCGGNWPFLSLSKCFWKETKNCCKAEGCGWDFAKNRHLTQIGFSPGLFP